MKACASVSGGVIFIPATLKRKTLKTLNDNRPSPLTTDKEKPEPVSK